jgi:hexosaminidase
LLAIILAQAHASAAELVPTPRSVVADPGTYSLPITTSITSNSLLLQPLTGVAAQVLREHSTGATVNLQLKDDATLGDEGYRLTVASDGVTITAPKPAGVFYGLQTLDELLPPPGGATSIDDVTIVDSPAYRWRGLMLDVSRHFFSVATVKRYIDVAAHYKLNVFHWHLVDDQGWRIQINRYPRLTSVGSCRAQTEVDQDATEFDGKPYCGYYTQAQIRDVIAYAKARFVTIVPEIEMPGHSEAALAAYPQLACHPGPYKVLETWGITTNIYCPSDYTFNFLENVLTEVMALFPSEYIHIGGDETPKDSWKTSAVVHALMKREHIATYDGVQGYFDRRIEKFLIAHGRHMIGWDEILDGGVSRSATIMSWRGEQGGIKASRAGNDVVMTPDGPLYFDALQGDQNDEPEAIGGLTSTQDVYEYEPTPKALDATAAKHIVGIQGNIWSEYITTPDYLFYMLLPRALALSEIAWRDPHPRTWSTFDEAVGAQLPWMELHGYNFRIPNPSFSLDSIDLHFSSMSTSPRTVRAMTHAGSANVTLTTVVPGGVIHYTLDGSAPTAKSPVYSAPIPVTLDPSGRADINAVVVLQTGRVSTPSELILTRFP